MQLKSSEMKYKCTRINSWGNDSEMKSTIVILLLLFTQTHLQQMSKAQQYEYYNNKIINGNHA